MAVLFATLGHTPKLVMAPLRTKPEIRSLHVFYGVPQEADGKKALAAVRTTCESIGIELQAHAVKDAFGYGKFLHAFSKAHSALPAGTEVLFNGSGGTRVMVMAGTIFCFTHDVPLLYFDEYNTQEGTVIPLKAFRNLDRIGPTPRAILQRLQKKGPADMGTLAEEMGIAGSTMTAHIQKLQEAGTVQVDRDGKRRLVAILPELSHVDLEAKA